MQTLVCARYLVRDALSYRLCLISFNSTRNISCISRTMTARRMYVQYEGFSFKSRPRRCTYVFSGVWLCCTWRGRQKILLVNVLVSSSSVDTSRVDPKPDLQLLTGTSGKPTYLFLPVCMIPCVLNTTRKPSPRGEMEVSQCVFN